jgi:hypothetical protein
MELTTTTIAIFAIVAAVGLEKIAQLSKVNFIRPAIMNF